MSQPRDRIREKLKMSFIFNGLDSKELEVVVSAMEEKHFKTNDAVINQGDEGNDLYVIETGTLSCSRRFVPRNHELLGQGSGAQVPQGLPAGRGLR